VEIAEQIKYVQDKLKKMTKNSECAKYLKAILKSLKGIKNDKENEKRH
jgi:hypothetical protein